MTKNIYKNKKGTYDMVQNREIFTYWSSVLVGRWGLSSNVVIHVCSDVVLEQLFVLLDQMCWGSVLCTPVDVGIGLDNSKQFVSQIILSCARSIHLNTGADGQRRDRKYSHDHPLGASKL